MTYLPIKPPSATATATSLANPDTFPVNQGGVVRIATLAMLDAYLLGGSGVSGSTGSGSPGSTGSTGSGSTGSTGTVTPAVSGQGTLITTPGPAINDGAGNTYAFNSSGFVVANGTPEDGLNGHAATANVNAIYWDGAHFWQRNTAGNWYTRTSVLATFTGPAQLPASPAIFTVTLPGIAIVDGSGNIMTLSADGHVITNGTVEDGSNGTPPTANVVEEYWDGSNFWQKNSSGNWYYRPNIGTAYTGPAGDPTAPGAVVPVSPTSGVANSLPAPVGSASNTVPQATGSDVQVYLAKPQGWNVPASLYGISCGHMSLNNVQKYSALATTNLQNAIKSLKFGLIRLNWDKTATMGYAFDSGSFDTSSVDTFINNAGVFNFPGTQLIITIGWSSVVGNAIDAGNVDSVTATHQNQCNQMAAYFKSKGLTGIYWECVNEPDAEQTSDMLTLAKVFNAMRAGIKAADSTAKCGGITASYRNDGQIVNWYNNCSPKPDFITWHSYLSSGLNEAEAVTLNKVLGANTNFASLRSSLGGFAGPMGDTERNWNGTPTDNAPQNQNVVGACFMAADQLTQIQGDHNAVFNATWDIWGDATYGMIDYSDYHVYPTGLLLTRLTTTMPGEALGMSLGPNLTGASVSNGSSTGNGHLLGLSTVLNGRVAVELVNIGDGALTTNLVLNGFTGSSVTKAEHSPANPNGVTSTVAITGGTGVAVTVPAKSCVVLAG